MAKYAFIEGGLTNVNGIDYDITIFKEDASDPGSVSSKIQGARLDYTPLGEEEIYNRIWGSKATITFTIGSNAQSSKFQQMLADQEETYFLEITKNGSIYWQGVVINDLIAFPSKNVATNYPIEIIASDGLTELVERPIDRDWYNDNDIEDWADETTFLKLIYQTLDQFDFAGTTNGQFRLRTVFDWWHSDQLDFDATTTGRDPLIQMLRTTDNWLEKNTDNGKEYATYGEILREICELCNAQLFYSAGYYYFVDVYERTQTNLTYNQFANWNYDPQNQVTYTTSGGTFGSSLGHTFTIPTTGQGRIQAGAVYGNKPATGKVIQKAKFLLGSGNDLNSRQIDIQFWNDAFNTANPSPYHKHAFRSIFYGYPSFYEEVTVKGTLNWNGFYTAQSGSVPYTYSNTKWVARIYVGDPSGTSETPGDTYDEDGTWKSGGYFDVQLGQLTGIQKTIPTSSGGIEYEFNVPLEFKLESLDTKGRYTMTILILCYDFAGNFVGGSPNITGLTYPVSNPTYVQDTWLIDWNYSVNADIGGQEREYTFFVEASDYSASSHIVELPQISTLETGDQYLLEGTNALKLHKPDGAGDITPLYNGEITNADSQWANGVGSGTRAGKLWEERMQRLMRLIGTPRQTLECEFRGANHFYQKLSYDSKEWIWLRWSYDLWTETNEGIMEEIEDNGLTFVTNDPIVYSRAASGPGSFPAATMTEANTRFQTLAYTDGAHNISGGAITTINIRDGRSGAMRSGDKLTLYFPSQDFRQEVTLDADWNGEGSSITVSSFTPDWNIEDGTPIIVEQKEIADIINEKDKRRVKTLCIETPTDSDEFTLMYTDTAITITQLNDALGGSTSITWNIHHATTRNNGTPNNLFGSARVTSSASGAETSSFNDETIPAGSWVWFAATSMSGTPDLLSISIEYTYDH